MRLQLNNTLSNQEISQLLSFISQVVGMDEKNHFRARAYEVAAVVVGQLDYELHDHFSKLSLKEFQKETDNLPGIGEAITLKLIELFTTGNITSFEKYTKHLPEGMYPLMHIHGIGAKKAFTLAKQFNLNNADTAVEALLTKAKHGQIRGLTGFGEKSEQDLIEALEAQHHKGRIPRKDAQRIAENIKAVLEKSGLVQKVIFLGSLRRGAETVGDIDLGVAAKDTKAVGELITSHPMVKRVLLAGDNLVSIVVENGWQVDIKFAHLKEWGSFIQHFTGGKEHNIKLREFALKKGYSLSEHGIKNKETGELKTFESEESFYKFLGFSCIPPEKRVGGNELQTFAL